MWALVAVVAVVVVAGVVATVREATRKVPSFPSLTEHPDPSLHGTVAYYAKDGCVHIVAASGAADKLVPCLPRGQDVKQAEKLGKLIGPQLVWLPDGRLEVTMFRMTGPPGPGETWHKGWQKRVDVATGGGRSGSVRTSAQQVEPRHAPHRQPHRRTGHVLVAAGR